MVYTGVPTVCSPRDPHLSTLGWVPRPMQGATAALPPGFRESTPHGEEVENISEGSRGCSRLPGTQEGPVVISAVVAQAAAQDLWQGCSGSMLFLCSLFTERKAEVDLFSHPADVREEN